jgi:hypothetical protein
MRPDSGHSGGRRLPAVVTDRDLAECADMNHYVRLRRQMDAQRAKDPNYGIAEAVSVKDEKGR